MEDSKIWVGLFGVTSKSDLDLLNGSSGAYVNILGPANNREDFLSKVSEKLEEQGFYLIEKEDIDTVENRRFLNKLGQEVLTLRNLLGNRNSIVLGTFYTYDYDDA